MANLPLMLSICSVTNLIAQLLTSLPCCLSAQLHPVGGSPGRSTHRVALRLDLPVGGAHHQRPCTPLARAFAVLPAPPGSKAECVSAAELGQDPTMAGGRHRSHVYPHVL